MRKFGLSNRLRAFSTRTRENILGEIQAGRLFEHLAEMKRARIDRFGYLAQGQILGLILDNVFLGPLDHRRLGVLAMHHNLVADRPKYVRRKWLSNLIIASYCLVDNTLVSK